MPSTQTTRPAPPRPQRRRLLFAVLAAVVLVALAGAVPTWGIAVPTMLSRLGGDDPAGVAPVGVAPPAPILTQVGELFAGTSQPLTGDPAMGELAGDRVVIAADETELLVADLATGEPVGPPLTDRRYLTAVAAGELAGSPIAVAGRYESDQGGWDLRVWDLTTGEPIGEPLTGHADMVTSIAIGELAGDTVAVSGSLDGELRAWDLTTGEPIGELLTGPGRINEVAIAELAGDTVAVSSGSDGTLRIWDLATGEQVTLPTDDQGPAPRVSTVAIGELDGDPVAVTDGHWPVGLWNLATGKEIGKTVVAEDSITSLAYTTLDGAPVAVAGYGDGAMRVWDLATVATREVMSEPLLGELGAGHTDMVTSLAVSELAGDPVVISSGLDGRTFVWRLG